jgi:hypothetical protein
LLCNGFGLRCAGSGLARNRPLPEFAAIALTGNFGPSVLNLVFFLAEDHKENHENTKAGEHEMTLSFFVAS